MYCSKCGNKLSDGDIYCASCGKKVTESSVGAQTIKKTINFNNLRSRKLKYGVFAVIVVICICFARLYSISNSPEHLLIGKWKMTVDSTNITSEKAEEINDANMSMEFTSDNKAIMYENDRVFDKESFVIKSKSKNSLVIGKPTDTKKADGATIYFIDKNTIKYSGDGQPDIKGVRVKP